MEAQKNYSLFSRNRSQRSNVTELRLFCAIPGPSLKMMTGTTCLELSGHLVILLLSSQYCYGNSHSCGYSCGDSCGGFIIKNLCYLTQESYSNHLRSPFYKRVSDEKKSPMMSENCLPHFSALQPAHDEDSRRVFVWIYLISWSPTGTRSKMKMMEIKHKPNKLMAKVHSLQHNLIWFCII